MTKAIGNSERVVSWLRFVLDAQEATMFLQIGVVGVEPAVKYYLV